MDNHNNQQAEIAGLGRITTNQLLNLNKVQNGAILITDKASAYKFYDRFPVTPGHTLIIPKRHVSNYFDLCQEELGNINELQFICRDVLHKKYKPQGFNLGVNVGEAAGQTIFHCHIHLIPRYTGDVANPRGGVRGVIPERQNY